MRIEGVIKVLAFQKHMPPALVMEDLGGESLRSLIDAGRIDLQAFLAPACRLCEALVEMQRRGWRIETLHRRISS